MDRIFDDDSGLLASRSTAPFLLQAYERDLGGGRKELVKEADAPIAVQGRHWGAVRVGFGLG